MRNNTTFDLDEIRSKARAYAAQCKTENRTASLRAFSRYFGKYSQWLGGTSNPIRLARQAVIEEFEASGVTWAKTAAIVPTLAVLPTAKTSRPSLEQIKDEARVYAHECNAANEPVSLCDFALRLGFNRQWLSSYLTSNSRAAREVVLKEWASVGVKASNTLAVALAEAADGGEVTERIWEIPPQQWPAIAELPRILATAGRREMFEHIRNNYGREAAMRYAYICDHPPAKGARASRSEKEVARAVV